MRRESMILSLAAVSPAKGGLACAGAAHKRRATLVACVIRSSFGTRITYGKPLDRKKTVPY